MKQPRTITTHRLTHDPCPECGGYDSTLWAGSGPGWDEWSCRCGHQWTIPINEPK